MRMEEDLRNDENQRVFEKVRELPLERKLDYFDGYSDCLIYFAKIHKFLYPTLLYDYININKNRE